MLGVRPIVFFLFLDFLFYRKEFLDIRKFVLVLRSILVYANHLLTLSCVNENFIDFRKNALLIRKNTCRIATF